MFAYCNNNPINFKDSSGNNAEAVQWWTAGMAWLPFVDAVLPIGDIIYVAGIVLLGSVALFDILDDMPSVAYTDSGVANGLPSPNNNDDDDDDNDYYDEYYDDESNFGGRQRIGKNNGNAPRNNQAQNKQFRDATKGLSKDQQRALHDEISGEGLGFHDLLDAAQDIWLFIIGLFVTEDE